MTNDELLRACSKKGKGINSNVRQIITVDEHGNITVPNEEIWMSEYEIADLLGVFGHTIRTQVKKIYRDGLLHSCTGRQSLLKRLERGL